MERALIINHLLQKVLKKTISPFKYINKTYQIKALKVNGISACRLINLSRVEDTTNVDLVGKCDIDVESVKNGGLLILLCHFLYKNGT